MTHFLLISTGTLMDIDKWNYEINILRSLDLWLWAVFENCPDYIILSVAYIYLGFFVFFIAIRLSLCLWIFAGLLYIETTFAEMRNMKDALRLSPGDDA